MDNKLTEKQVESWRKILALQYGPYAFIMPVEEVQAIRDKTQAEFDQEDFCPNKN